METVKVNTSQHIDIDYPVAGLGERVAARLIDIAIFVGIWLVFIMLSLATGFFSRNETVLVILIIFFAFAIVFYDLLCEIFMNGQSVGKRVLKIKVISLNGGQPTIGQYFLRWIFRFIDFTVVTAWVGGLISVAVTEKKQRIGDLVAGTTLIKTVPRTTFQHIAFQPVANEYIPTFDNVNLMSDRDIELVHEVLRTYYKTLNPDLIYHMAGKVANHLNITTIPTGMNELDFLRTITMDYNQITSRTV
ncbi:MAG: RDD family protein [Pedobacter sp.]|nr:MAG: RDD family protein [Pedobacter sp.]